MQDELQREHVARLVALDRTADERSEVLLHPLRRDGGEDRLVGGVVVGEQRDVADVALVAAAGAAEVTKSDATHG